MTKKLILAYMIVLFLLHQDYWLKDDASLALGFIPAGLAYHMLFTVLAAFGWWLVVKFAWPAFAEESDRSGDRKAKTP